MEVAGTEELDVTSNLDITVNGPEDVTAIDPTDTEVQVVKRAYTVVGDNVYVPTGSYDDAPDWVKTLVQNVVNFEVDARDTNLLANVDSILSLFENGYVPKNQYDNYVIQQQTAYDSLTTRVDSLDATVQTNETDVNAKIQNIENTYATTDSAAALVATGIQASINDTVSGTSIGSKIASVQQTVADLDSTYSANYDVLTSSLADIDTKTDASATAVSGLTTRVSQTESGILANASDITNLSVELSSGTNSWAAADTSLTNTLNQTIADGITAAESNFEYNSNLTINGITKQSGFGIVNEFSSVNNAPATGESEFWINADKFKFTNSANTGVNAPFTIDATGTQPEITFNGKVSFNAVNDVYRGTVNNAVSALGDASVRQNWAACYGSATLNNITYDVTQSAVRLYSGSDTSIGMCTTAQPVGDATSFSITVTFKASTTVTSGIYFRVQEYDTAIMPAGKTHISANATLSEIRVQEATRQVTSLYENLGATTSWQTKTFTYTPTSTAKNFSFLALNWTGLGTGSLYIRDVEITSQAPDISGQLPQTVTSSSAPTPSNILPVGSIWRQSLTVNSTTQYTHWISQGSGVWRNVGGTYINGSEIITGTIDAEKVAVTNLAADSLSPTTGTSTVWTGGGLVSANFNGLTHGDIGAPTAGFRLSSNAAGTSDDPNIYGAYIKGSTFEAIDVSFGEIRVKSSTLPLTNSGAISYTMNSGYLYGSSYSTGYLINRVCGSTSQILIRGSMDWSCSNVTSYDFRASLQYSIDDGTWVTLDSGREYFVNYASYVSSTGKMNLYGLLSGSAVPSTSTISFRMLETLSTGGSTSNLGYTVTLTNS